MTIDAYLITYILATLTLLVHLSLIPLFLLWMGYHTKKTSTISSYIKWFAKRASLFAFVVTLVAVSGSLFLSEIMGFIPCKLCWIQRIFIYPMPILLLISMLRKDKKIFTYILPLAITSFFVSVYHYSEQIIKSMQPAPEVLVPCSLGGEISCSSFNILEYGYISIPMMAMTAMAFVIILMLFLWSEQRS